MSETGSAAERFRAALQEEEGRQRADAVTTSASEPAAPRVPETPTALRFAETLRLARDPANASATGSVCVTGHSDWVLDPCRVCRHTFREGDQAWLEVADGKVRAVHDSTALPCHSGLAPSESALLSASAARFMAELRTRYEVDRQFRVAILKPGHPLLRGDFMIRKTCKGCAHTFRPFERAARCPCNPEAPPAKCRLYAHCDPARSQFCFDVLADPSRKHCPMDGHQLPKRTH